MGGARNGTNKSQTSQVTHSKIKEKTHESHHDMQKLHENS